MGFIVVGNPLWLITTTDHKIIFGLPHGGNTIRSAVTGQVSDSREELSAYRVLDKPTVQQICRGRGRHCCVDIHDDAVDETSSKVRIG